MTRRFMQQPPQLSLSISSIFNDGDSNDKDSNSNDQKSLCYSQNFSVEQGLRINSSREAIILEARQIFNESKSETIKIDQTIEDIPQIFLSGRDEMSDGGKQGVGNE